MSKATDYDKMTPIEHILARPDTYIGSVKSTTAIMDVCDDINITNRIIKYVPGFMKCFDELLVNARDASESDHSCDMIRIEYNTEKQYIKVYNNGDKGIPVEEHPKFKTLVPSMIFGELLTSSNYDDTMKRTGGGRNGYGAKLANVYSSRFIVEVGDNARQKKFYQEWTNNMGTTNGPKISKFSKKSYVEVTFYPDFKRFNLEGLDSDHMSLFYRRAIDIAGVSSDKIKVYFNDTKINVTNFKQYITLYYPTNEIYYDDTNERWKVGCIYIQDSNNKTISFVNGIATYKGGTHVSHVVDKVIKLLVDNHIKKKNKDIKISPTVLKENLVFFINSVIDNPSFDSQTKETLSTEIKEFGSKYEPSDAFIKKLAKCGIVEQVIELAKFKESSLLKKNDGKKQKTLYGIPKLEDANEAGGKYSTKCSLILTEGDSAKTIAVAGLSVVGRDYYGVFPLKGKMLNVREASVKQMMDNEEISNLKKIIGLKHDMKYVTDEEFSTLRYGRIICLTDQDVDGSHIKGLIMNLFHHIWPALVQRENFVTSMATPIVKAFKGKKEMVFYNMTDYQDWVKNNSGWRLKYYKGLGTSSTEEAQVYFSGIEDKLIRYCWDSAIEGIEPSEDALTLAFQKNRSDDRKDWLMTYDRSDVLTYEERDVGYSDFINRDLKHFSNYDNNRSIPHIMDGLKPSQRKILYGAFLKGLDHAEMKVSQFAGIIGATSAYHHGEASLYGAITGMAQDFVGSNNINLLKPNGQFGSRLLGGKDCSAPRYIFTELSESCNLIFRKSDANILNNQEEDGMPIEPEYYAPIIPMILVNGASGIGTGFSTDIPCYNPLEIIDNIVSIIDKKKYKEMIPYWRGFTGIVEGTNTCFETKGLYTVKNNQLIITELPVGTWTQTYKDFLEKLYETEQLKKNKDDRNFIGYREYHTDKKVHFELQFSDGYIETVKDIGKTFHLSSKFSTTNMHLYSVEGRITKYSSPKAILDEWYIKRLELYELRRENQLNELKLELEMISNKTKFILMVVNDELIISKRKKVEIEAELEENDFTKMGCNESYDYLLSMYISQLTFEKIEELKKQEKDKQVQYNTLFEMTPYDIWKIELCELKAVLEKNLKNDMICEDKAIAKTKTLAKIKAAKTNHR